MRDQELVSAIRRLKVETGSLACMGCGHARNCGVSGCAVMRAAADRIANQNTNIEALQQEIEKLRGQVPRWIPVEENLFPGGANLAGGCGGGNPRQAIVYVTNPDAPRNCCAGGFGSTKIGEEAE